MTGDILGNQDLSRLQEDVNKTMNRLLFVVAVLMAESEARIDYRAHITHNPPAHTRPRFPVFKGKISSSLPSSQLIPRSSWRRHDMCHEMVSDSFIGVQAGSDTTRSAMQVGLRTVKACLGGHDDGVSGVDEVVENTSILLRKPGRLAVSE